MPSPCGEELSTGIAAKKGLGTGSLPGGLWGLQGEGHGCEWSGLAGSGWSSAGELAAEPLGVCGRAQ